MFDIFYEINGKRVEPENITEEIMKSILEAMAEAVASAIKDMICSKHGQSPKIILKGKEIESLTPTVHGCCDEFEKMVAKKLENKLQ